MKEIKISVLTYLVVISFYHQPIAEVINGEGGQQFVGHKVQKSWREVGSSHCTLSLAFYLTVMGLTAHSHPQQGEQSLTISLCLSGRATKSIPYLYSYSDLPSFLSCWSSRTSVFFFFLSLINVSQR